MDGLSEQEAGRLKAGLLGYRDGLHEGADNERQRLAELLGIRTTGTLALLGAGKESYLAALREIQAAVTDRIVEIVESPISSAAIDNLGEIQGREKA